MLRSLSNRLGTQAGKQRTVLVQHGDLLGELVHVSDRMDQRITHVAANIGASFGDEWHASATHSLHAHQAEAFLNAGQYKEIALPHQVWHIVAMTENLYAWVRKHLRKFLCVHGNLFP